MEKRKSCFINIIYSHNPQFPRTHLNLFLMSRVSLRELENFKSLVGIKFQLYNSLFISLPFHRVEKTGILLSLFLNNCEEGYGKNHTPSPIADAFCQRT